MDEPGVDAAALALGARIAELRECYGDDRERILAAARCGDLEQEEPEVTAALCLTGAFGWPQPDSDETRELVDRALAALKRIDDASHRARAFCGMATYLASEGEHQPANRLLAEALVGAGPRERALVLITRADGFARVHEFDAAISDLREVLAIGRSLDDAAIQKHALAELGSALSLAQEPLVALEVFTELRALGDARGDTSVQAAAWAGLGRVHRDLGDPRKALEAAHKQLELSERLEPDNYAAEGRAKALHAIGLLHLDLGDPHEAFRRFDEALAIEAELGSFEGRIRVLHEMGTAHLMLGAIDQARECLREVAFLSVKLKDAHRYAHAINGLGRVEEEAGDLHAAEKLYARAIAAHRVSRDTQGLAVAASNRGRMLERLGARDNGLDVFVAARDELAHSGNEWAVAKQDGTIGTTLIELGDRQGFRVVAAARDKARELGDRHAVFTATSNLAAGLALRPELHDGGVEEALAISTGEVLTLVGLANDDASLGALSADAYETLRSTVAAVVAGGAGHAWKDRELARISCYRTWAALDFAWNMAARLQIEREITAARSATPDVAARIARFREAQARLASLRRAPSDMQAEGAAGAAQRASALSRARSEVRRIEGELHWTLFADRARLLLEGGRGQPDLAALGKSFLSALTGLTRHGVAVVAYVTTGELAYAFVATTDRMVLRPLPVNGYQLMALSRLLTWGLEKTGHRYGAVELCRILIASIADVIGERDLLIAADGPLADLPFGALDPRLQDARGEGSLANVWHLLQQWRLADPEQRLVLTAQLQRQAQPFRSVDHTAALFDLRAVSVCPSILTAHALAENDYALRERPSGGARLIGVADPTVASSDSASASHLWPLKHARSEVRAVATLLGGDHQILEGPDATRDRLSAAVNAYAQDGVAHVDVMHFAAHGVEVFRDADNPALGTEVAIVLADGVLTSLDLAEFRVRNFVTSLLCCHSRRGSAPSRWVDESGLSLGFHLAGATYVVSCTSSVPDASTEALATRFYRHLVDGDGPAHALAAAQREVRDLYPDASAWAPFVVSGPPDPQARM